MTLPKRRPESRAGQHGREDSVLADRHPVHRLVQVDARDLLAVNLVIPPRKLQALLLPRRQRWPEL